MKVLIYIGIITFSFNSFTQTNFLWAKSIGGVSSATTMVKSMDIDNNGNLYTVGFFDGTVDFDPGVGASNLTSAGGTGDIFISKINPSGNHMWTKRIGGSNLEIANSVKVDGNGNVIVGGTYSGAVDFDPGAGVFNLAQTAGSLTNTVDGFILKLDASGNFIWAKSIGGVDNDFLTAIALDNMNNIYATGRFYNTCDFDPGAGTFNLTLTTGSNASTSDIFIVKLNSSGSFVWAKSMGGTNNDIATSISLDGSGNVYTTGSFDGTCDFNPGAGVNNLTPIGGSDVFVSKLDATGNFVWAKGMGGAGFEIGNSIVIDASGQVVIAGTFTGTSDFDPGASVFNLNLWAGSNPYTSDIFVVKLNSTGNFIWAKSMGGADSESVNSMDIDASGNIYTTGSFSGTADFNTDLGGSASFLTSAGNVDAFISKLNSSGNYVWAKRIGSTNWDEGNSIAIDNSQNVYTSGRYKGTVDFDPEFTTYNITSVGFYDMFVHKMGQCILNTNVVVNGSTLSSNWNGATYQWLDCNNNFSPISGATIQSFTPSTNGNYAVMVTYNGCVDTTTCYSYNLASIEENKLNEIRVFPNPATHTITIQSISKEQLVITNLTGKVILTAKKEHEIKSIEIEHLPNGIYFIHQGNSIVKFIKE